MRPLILLCLALAACAADPVLLPDSGPCASACGAGTTCVAGACVAIDAGGADVPAVDVGEDRPALPDAGPQDAGADVLAAADAAEDRPTPMDVADVPRADVPPDTGCTELFCGGRCVDHSAMNCGACGVVCTATLPHTRPGCVERGGVQVCAWGCETGWGNCDGDPTNGCEYTLFGVDSGFCPRP